MKKATVLIIAIIMLFATSLSVQAAHTYNYKDVYSIEFPDEYTYSEEFSQPEIPIYIKDDSSADININYTPNTDKLSFKDCTEKEIEDYKALCESMVKLEYAKTGTTVEVGIFSMETV